VLRHNARRGQANKPPMKAEEMMALAMELLTQYREWRSDQ
jgi:hypothetical protein